MLPRCCPIQLSSSASAHSPPQRRAFGKQSMSNPRTRFLPSPTSRRLLPDATSSTCWKLSLLTQRTAASKPNTTSNTIYCPPRKQCNSSQASTRLDHSSISSKSHSSNACRRWYRLRYEIRLNPTPQLQPLNTEIDRRKRLHHLFAFPADAQRFNRELPTAVVSSQ